MKKTSIRNTELAIVQASSKEWAVAASPSQTKMVGFRSRTDAERFIKHLRKNSELIRA